MSLENKREIPFKFSETKSKSAILDEKQFYENGYKLSMKYLPNDSFFSKKFGQCLKPSRKSNFLLLFQHSN